jgi:hypothetical protein
MLYFGVVTDPGYPDRLAIQLLHEIYKQWKNHSSSVTSTSTASNISEDDDMKTILRDACVKYDELSQVARRMQTLKLAKDHDREQFEQSLLSSSTTATNKDDNQNVNSSSSSGFWRNTGIERMDDETVSTSSSSSASSLPGNRLPAWKNVVQKLAPGVVAKNETAKQLRKRLIEENKRKTQLALRPKQVATASAADAVEKNLSLQDPSESSV